MPQRVTQEASSGAVSRRDLFEAAGLLGLGALNLLSIRPAAARPAEMQEAIAAVIGGARVNVGRVKLDIPPLVENGNVVPCEVTVASPMTSTDYVKAIHVFNEKNPQPNVISAKLDPRAGRARIATRIRLAQTQTIVAIAEMSDGSFWKDSVSAVITLGACLEDGI
jgi:sulfur-oxidizing protein SoxY